jgi:hypothetical protein
MCPFVGEIKIWSVSGYRPIFASRFEKGVSSSKSQNGFSENKFLKKFGEIDSSFYLCTPNHKLGGCKS